MRSSKTTIKLITVQYYVGVKITPVPFLLILYRYFSHHLLIFVYEYINEQTELLLFDSRFHNLQQMSRLAEGLSLGCIYPDFDIFSISCESNSKISQSQGKDSLRELVVFSCQTQTPKSVVDANSDP